MPPDANPEDEREWLAKHDARLTILEMQVSLLLREYEKREKGEVDED